MSIVSADFKKFVALEASLFMAQTMVFFLVAFFFSHFLSSKELLDKYTSLKFSEHLLPEFWFTMLGVIVVLGTLSLVAGFAGTTSLGVISAEVLQEVPRTIYFFGTTLTGTAMAWVMYHAIYGDTSSSLDALKAVFVLSGGSFSFGIALKAGLNRTRKLEENRNAA